jgi:hypothetical protein
MNALAPCKLCGTPPLEAGRSVSCPNPDCDLWGVVLSQSRWQELHGPPAQACQRCESGAATMRSLCDKCFSAGVASVRVGV